MANTLGGRDSEMLGRAFAALERPAQWPAREPSALSRQRHRALLATIVFLAALLRLNHVDQPLIDTFSWRQASTAMMADNYYRTSWNIFYPEVSWTGPGPNYQGREFQTFSYLVALLYAVFGQYEWIGRAVSAGFGTWGVFAMYALVRRVWDTPRALAAALVLAIIPGAIFIDRSFLPDPAMLSLTITAMWLLVRALQTGKSGHLFLACVMTSLAFLTKLPGIVALAPMVYAAVVTGRSLPRASRKRRAAVLIGSLVLTLLPVAAYYRWALYLGETYPPYHVAGAANWLWRDGIAQWLSQGYFLDSILGNITSWLWTTPVVGLVLVGCVIAPPVTRDPHSDSAEPPPAALRWFFHWWLAGCVVLVALGARELSENVWNMHVFNIFAAAMGGHALVLIAGVPRFVGLRDSAQPRHAHPLAAPFATVPAGFWRVAVLAVVIVAFGQYRLTDFYADRARHSHQLGLALQKHSQPGDLVVTMADDVGDPIAIYYSHRRGWVFPQPQTYQDTPDPWKQWNLIPPDPKRTIAMFEDLRRKGAKWFGAVNSPKDDTPGRRTFWNDHPEVVRHIHESCEVVDRDHYGIVYRILSPDELAARAATQPDSP